MKNYKMILALVLIFLPIKIYAYPKEILQEFTEIQNTFQNNLSALLLVRNVSPQDIDPAICKALNEFTENTYLLLEKNQQYLDENERQEIKSRIFLTSTVKEFQESLSEKEIYCSNN